MNVKIVVSLLIACLLGVVIEKVASRNSKIEQSQIMQECIKDGGQFSIHDWSWRDDGSDYRATCEVVSKSLWSIKL